MDILQEFSKYLQAADPRVPAKTVLASWLFERLATCPKTLTDKVLHCELSISLLEADAATDLSYTSTEGNNYTFTSESKSGKRLLNSLYHYSLSYENQKWVRFIHKLKASDFNGSDVNEDVSDSSNI